MTEKDFSPLNEQEFEALLVSAAGDVPPPAVSDGLKPWQRSLRYVLWGTALTTLTLRFWNLDTILPVLGYLLLFLGYRGLRRENRAFTVGFAASCVELAWFVAAFFLRLTVYDTAAVQYAGALLMLPFMAARVLLLRSGIRAVQKKAGLAPHGGTGFVVWYVAALVLAALRVEGLLVWVMLLAYGLALWQLFGLKRELDEAGYALDLANLRCSDRACAAVYAAILLVLALVAYTCCNRYPMDWAAEALPASAAVEQVKRELTDLGFPADVLQDLTEEELLSFSGARNVVVAVRDYDMEQGRGIGTQQEIAGGKVALITDAEGARELRFTQVGVRFTDAQGWDSWTVIHHFRWLMEEPMPGTEALQLTPTDHLAGWMPVEHYTGRVLCDRAGERLAAPYYSLGYESYTNFLLSITHSGARRDLFAAFSMPDDGRNCRGYVLYEVKVATEGWLLDSWFTYVHHTGGFQFPVLTAQDWARGGYPIRSSVDAFTRAQTALQLQTHEETPGLIG